MDEKGKAIVKSCLALVPYIVVSLMKLFLITTVNI